MMTPDEAEHRATGLRAKSVARPIRAAALPTSRYGYPIMAAVARSGGRADFGTVSTFRLITLATFDLCGLCGLPFGSELRWQLSTHIDTVSNPESYWNAFSEPPVHKICLTYAALVCPFLRSPAAKARDPELRMDATLRERVLAYGLAKTVGIQINPSDPDHQLRFIQTELVESDEWNDLDELAGGYLDALAREAPIPVDANLGVVAAALNRSEPEGEEIPGLDAFMAALLCGAALIPEVGQLGDTRSIFDNAAYNYLADMARREAFGEPGTFSLGPGASPVLTAALGWLRAGEPLPAVIASWRATASPTEAF